jgi:hypothetical protein
LLCNSLTPFLLCKMHSKISEWSERSHLQPWNYLLGQSFTSARILRGLPRQ